MLESKWFLELIDALISAFTIYLFFFYFSIFFDKRKGKVRVLIGILLLIVWQIGIPNVIGSWPLACRICVTVSITILAVIIIYEGVFWKKCFFSIAFDAIWMLAETLVGDFLMIYCEPLARSLLFGSFVSKIILFLVLAALKIVFTNEEVVEIPVGHSILLILIPIGSIYIMNSIFLLAYKTKWEYAKVPSLVSIILLLLMNILVFYIYIKLADDLHIRRMNIVYEQQLDLCERHQEETELSILQIRDIRHNMKNNFISILAYAEKGQYEKIIKFINDVMEEGNLKVPVIANSGNIVTDSLIGYWYRTAGNEGIKFQTELCIPMEMPFRGADISLILGNLLENAVEAASKVKEKKYIRLSMKYDKSNLLIVVENSYEGKLIKTKEKGLKSTKSDAENHGIGLPSVRRTAKKYHGTMSIDDTILGRFIVRVVLYGI